MKRFFFAAMVLVMATGLQPQAAHAQTANANWNAFWDWLGHGQDPRLTATGIGLGIGADAVTWELTKKHHAVTAGNYRVWRTVTPLAAYGITSYGCIVAYPFIATLWLNRPLTPREMYIGTAECIVPFIGGWFVNTYLPHTAWYDGTPEKKHK